MVRLRAPQLHGDGGWIGVDHLDLAALRGRVVLLDFWTPACVNCLRVIEELRGLERRWQDELVVIGVHSPKFSHERDHAAARAAVARHRVEHPVLDDPALTTWSEYAIRAWPTQVLVDPEGYEIARWSGEGHAVAVSRKVEETVLEHERRGTLRRGAVELERVAAGTGELAFPGKVAVQTASARTRRCSIRSALPRARPASCGSRTRSTTDCGCGASAISGRCRSTASTSPGVSTPSPDGRLVVADTGNHRVVVVDPVEATMARLDVGRPGSLDVAAPVVADTLVLAAGGRLEVVLDLPLSGDALDVAAGAPVRVRAEADPPELLRGGQEWTAGALPVTVSLALAHEPGASGRVTVELLAATCDPSACRLRRTQRAYDLILT